MFLPKQIAISYFYRSAGVTLVKYLPANSEEDLIGSLGYLRRLQGLEGHTQADLCATPA